MGPFNILLKASNCQCYVVAFARLHQIQECGAAKLLRRHGRRHGRWHGRRLLVHRAHMPAQIARLPERSATMRARVVSLGPLDLLHLSWLCGPAVNALVVCDRDQS